MGWMIAAALAGEPAPSVPAPTEPVGVEGDPGVTGPASAEEAASAVKLVHWSEVQPKVQYKPDFPQEATRLGIREETCVVQLKVDALGNVFSVTPKSCSDLFFPVAKEAAMKWTFYPPREDGEPIASSFALAFKFTDKKRPKKR